MDVREKLLELLTDISRNDRLRWYNLRDMRNAAEDIADLLIAHGVTVQEWVKVGDRLPEKPGRYLVEVNRTAPENLGGNSTRIIILRFLPEREFRLPVHFPKWINDEIKEEVTHWMPLPRPPK